MQNRVYVYWKNSTAELLTVPKKKHVASAPTSSQFLFYFLTCIWVFSPYLTINFLQLEKLEVIIYLWFQVFNFHVTVTVFKSISLTKRFNCTSASGEVNLLQAFSVKSEVLGTCLNRASCVRLATALQRKPDSVAPKTGQRLMICDSFNEPGYEQSSCSPYISRNSCCFDRLLIFFFFFYCSRLTVNWKERGFLS